MPRRTKRLLLAICLLALIAGICISVDAGIRYNRTAGAFDTPTGIHAR